MKFPRSAKVLVTVLLTAMLLIGALVTGAAALAPAPSRGIGADAGAAPTAPTLASTPPHSLSWAQIGMIGIAAAAAVGLTMAATTQFGTTNGLWETAANWSNGLPSATKGAIVSSTGGVPVLGYGASAVCSSLAGGGTIGIQAGAVSTGGNKLTIGSTVLRLVSVEAIEHSSTADKPMGHG